MSNTSAKRSIGAQPKASLSSIPSSSPVTNPEEYIHSSLIHEVYLYNDLKNDFPKFWGRTGIAEGGFDYFYQGLKELALDIKTITSKKLDHSQTLTEVIIPTLAALGWNTSKETTVGKNITVVSSSGDEIAIKPTALLFATESDATAFKNHYKNSATPLKDFNQIPVATSYFASWSEQRNGRYEKSREQFGKFGDLFSNFSTDEQAYNYLELLGSEWSFSTDGHSWRLIKKSAFQTDHTKYFEFNLWAFLNALHSPRPHEEDALIEISKYFYWFFSKESHHRSKPNQIGVTWERSQKYTDTLEDDLRGRFVAAMSVGVNSLWNSAKEKGINLDLQQIQGITESLIFNSLFIRSCESRRVLVLHPNYRPVSLHNLVSKLRDIHPTDQTLNETTITRLQAIFQKNISDDGTELFDYIINLFDLTNDSEKKSRTFGFAIEGFKENIFSKEEWTSLKKVKIDNLSLAKVFTLLFYFDDSIQIPFNLITPQQFGSIFESFLEFKLSPAPTTQYLIRRIRKAKGTENKIADISWTSGTKSSDGVIYTAKRGSLFFRSDNSDRKVSGTYFTPDQIVDLIVKEALTPICKDKSPEEILTLKVCDPAMGSGHFLISALRFLTKEYLKASTEKNLNAGYIKKQILHRCIFGADKEPRAVKLAKLALWLETAEPGKELEHLDDQLKATNSLIDSKLWKNEWKFLPNGIDAVIGNPPYLGEKGNKNVFREIRENSAFGEKHYMRKMDLFYFFFALAADLLKKDGIFGMITTNYWVTADGAERLKKHLSENGAIFKYIDFCDAKLFESAKGQCNSITFYKKGSNWNSSKIELHRAENAFIKERDCLNRLTIDDQKYFRKSDLNLIEVCPINDAWSIAGSRSTKETKSNRTDINLEFEKIGKDSICRSVETGCDVVTDSLIKAAVEKRLLTNKNDILIDYRGQKIHYEKNQGIFVLTDKELKDSKIENEYIVDFYKNSSIGYYIVDETKRANLIYVDSSSSLPSRSNAFKHLDKFRPLLATREQAKNDNNNWYWIRGSKREKIYEKVTIVCPYRSVVPKFALSNKNVYGAGDIYHIFDFKGLSPEAYLTYLNSSFIANWMCKYGKPKGKMFELYQTPLSNLPAPTFLHQQDDKLRQCYYKIKNEIEKIKGPKSAVKDQLDLLAYSRMANEHFELKEFSKVIQILDQIDEIVNESAIKTGLLTNKGIKKKAA